MKKHIIYTLLTTLAFILLANIWAANVAKQMNLLSSIPTGLIDGYVSKMKGNYTTWFIGNSTLDNGVLIDKVEKGTGTTILKTPMGSATAEAMCLLAIQGLKATKKPPSQIYLFVTKDDFNKNGLRGITSRSYLKAMSGNSWKDALLSKIPLYSYRISIKMKYGKMLFGYFSKTKINKKVDTSLVVKIDSNKIKGIPINETHSAHLINLGQNYKLNIAGFKELAQICKQKRIGINVIFPPVTKSVANWQNFYYPKLNYNMVMGLVETELKNNGIQYTNYTDSIPSTTFYFKDEYHLNKVGAANFSSKLISKIKE